MNNALMFSKASDEWSTPQDFFDSVDAEFAFVLDAAASDDNFKVEHYLTQEDDALSCDWVAACEQTLACKELGLYTVWLNPPYSKCREFIAKAAFEASKGCTVVCLVPSRTDTRWFHDYVWDRERHTTRPGVEIRFVKGRLTFGGAPAGAPFPSVVIIFRGTK